MTIHVHIADAVALLFLGLMVYGHYLGAAKSLAWLRGRLQQRHETLCVGQNARWRGRIVRHPVQGTVGLCWRVCVKDGGWRDLLLPRWTATVVTLAPLAGVIQRPANGLFDAITLSLALQAGLAKGDIRPMPLRELALAPETEASAFQREMEESTL